MNILFIYPATMPDYLCDCLFHGLRTLFGNTVVDINKIQYMYTTFPEVEKSQLYGKGFSLYCLLDDINIDRTEIERKIINQYFDLIIYGSIYRCQNYLEIVLNNYSQNQIIFIDGEDHCNTLKFLLNRGFYFKRELYVENRYLLPIHFAIPKEKFVSNIQELEKDNFFAPCNPTDKTSYIYHAEKDYYQQYQESFYGITMKKAGWDCLRHYEIIAQGCAPYFYEIEECPYLTMHKFPRLEVIKLMQIADDYLQNQALDLESYLANLESLFGHAKKHLTTESLAKYVIQEIKT
jgi:hypothetical protein